MAKNRTGARPHGRRRYEEPDGDRDRAKEPRDGKRHLKHLDRRLQLFGAKVEALEDRVSRLSDDSDAELVLAVDALHRETLLLRAEIRDFLASGGRTVPEMTEYAEESWEQLREMYKEIKENLASEGMEKQETGTRRRRQKLEDEDDWEEGDGVEADELMDSVDSEA